MSAWPAIELGKVAEIAAGGGAPQDSDDFSNVGTPFVRAGSLKPLTEGAIESSLELLSEDVAKKHRLRLFPAGSVLFAKSGMSATKGIVYRLTSPAYVVSHLAAVISGPNLDSGYLRYCLQVFSPTCLIQDEAYPSIRLCDIAAMKIPLPPLEEQKLIKDILGRAEALRAKRRAALDQLDELTQSIFIEMFGDPIKNAKNWETLKFGEVGTLQRGISKHRPRNAPELLGGKYPLIQTGDVANSGGYITEYTQTYSELGLKQSKMWSTGTLCITIAANIAKTGILTFDACFPDSVVGFIPNEKVKIEYVQYWMSFLQKMLEESAPESAQKNINLKILFDLNIPVPPLELQNQFTATVHLIKKIKQSQQQSLLELNNLFDSLGHEAFTGKLFSHQFFEREIENGVKI